MSLKTFVPKTHAERPVEQQVRVTARLLTIGEVFRYNDRATSVALAPDGTRAQQQHSWVQAHELLIEHVKDVQVPGATTPFPKDGTADARGQWLLAHIPLAELYLIAHELPDLSLMPAAAGN